MLQVKCATEIIHIRHPPAQTHEVWPGAGSGWLAAAWQPCSYCPEPEPGSQSRFYQEPPAPVSLAAAAAATTTFPSWQKHPGFWKAA